MRLLGVIHLPEYLEVVCKCVDELFPENPKSIMLELPADWNEFSKTIDFWRHENYPLQFFSSIAEKYRTHGTNIIYGETASQEWSNLVGNFFKSNKKRNKLRERFMTQRIIETNPEIVIVGRKHAEEIKRKFTDAYYLALADGEFPYNKNLADKVIRLD